MRVQARELVGVLTTRIGRRFVALFAGSALVPLALFAWLVLARVGEQMNTELRANMQNGAKTAGMGLAARLSQVAGDVILAVEFAAKGVAQGSADLSALQEHVRERCEAVWLVQHGRTTTLAGTPLVQPEFTARELRHLAGGNLLVRSVGEPARLLMLKALDASPTSYAAVVIRNRWFWDPGELRTAGCDFLALVDTPWQVLFDTFTLRPALAPLIAAIGRNSASGTIEWAAGDEPHIARYWRAFLRPQYGFDMVVVQSRSTREAFEVRQAFVHWFVLTALGALLVVVWLSLTSLRRTLDPIVDLHAATRRVAGGSLDARVRLHGNDEFAALGASFNEMAAQLQANAAVRAAYEQELLASRDAALAAVRAKAEFVTNVSHELRTPMTEILSAVEILSGLGPEELAAREEFSQIALRGGQRLARLVDDVLELGGAPLDLAATALPPTFAAAAARLSEPQRQRLVIDALPELPPVRGNAERLTEVWTRLLDNACKFSDAPALVLLRARRDGDGVGVEIVDQGVGIAAADLERVFEPFCQVGRDQLTEKATGTGLGLTLAKNLVERHGGRLTLASTPGRGTTVRVWLPCEAALPVVVG